MGCSVVLHCVTHSSPSNPTIKSARRCIKRDPGRVELALRYGRTVDKFRDQEAPVVLYSLATSNPEDAPRGYGFSFSLKPPQCCNVSVAGHRDSGRQSAAGRGPVQTPKQMRLVNAFLRCRWGSADVVERRRDRKRAGDERRARFSRRGPTVRHEGVPGCGSWQPAWDEGGRAAREARASKCARRVGREGRMRCRTLPN
jgi:hypothetical protein